MADKQIGDLTEASALDGTELVHVVQGGNSRRATVGQLGGWRIISTHAPSAVATLDIALPSGYQQFRLSGWIRPATDGAVARLRFSSDGGLTFASGASDYEYQTVQFSSLSSGATDNATAAAFMRLHPFGIGNDATERFGLDIIIEDPANTGEHTMALWQGYRVDTGGVMASVMGSGRRKSTATMDYLRLLCDSGTIAAGKIILEGLPG